MKLEQNPIMTKMYVEYYQTKKYIVLYVVIYI